MSQEKQDVVSQSLHRLLVDFILIFLDNSTTDNKAPTSTTYSVNSETFPGILDAVLVKEIDVSNEESNILSKLVN